MYDGLEWARNKDEIRRRYEKRLKPLFADIARRTKGQQPPKELREGTGRSGTQGPHEDDDQDPEDETNDEFEPALTSPSQASAGEGAGKGVIPKSSGSSKAPTPAATTTGGATVMTTATATTSTATIATAKMDPRRSDLSLEMPGRQQDGQVTPEGQGNHPPVLQLTPDFSHIGERKREMHILLGPVVGRGIDRQIAAKQAADAKKATDAAPGRQRETNSRSGGMANKEETGQGQVQQQQPVPHHPQQLPNSQQTSRQQEQWRQQQQQLQQQQNVQQPLPVSTPLGLPQPLQAGYQMPGQGTQQSPQEWLVRQQEALEHQKQRWQQDCMRHMQQEQQRWLQTQQQQQQLQLDQMRRQMEQEMQQQWSQDPRLAQLEQLQLELQAFRNAQAGQVRNPGVPGTGFQDQGQAGGQNTSGLVMQNPEPPRDSWNSGQGPPNQGQARNQWIPGSMTQNQDPPRNSWNPEPRPPNLEQARNQWVPGQGPQGHQNGGTGTGNADFDEEYDTEYMGEELMSHQPGGDGNAGRRGRRPYRREGGWQGNRGWEDDRRARTPGEDFSIWEAQKSVRDFTATTNEIAEKELPDFIRSAKYFEQRLKTRDKAQYVRFLQATKIVGRAAIQIAGAECNTVDELHHVLRTRCCVKQRESNLICRLTSCKQGTRDLQAFLDELEDVSHQLEEMKPEAKDVYDCLKVEALVKRSAPHLAEKLFILGPTTWARTVEEARRLQHGDTTGEQSTVAEKLNWVDEKERVMYTKEGYRTDNDRQGYRSASRGRYPGRHERYGHESDRSRDRNFRDRSISRGRDRSQGRREGERGRTSERRGQEGRSRDRGDRRSYSREDRRGYQSPRRDPMEKIERLFREMLGEIRGISRGPGSSRRQEDGTGNEQVSTALTAGVETGEQ